MMGRMSEITADASGVLGYDLAGGIFCEECGRPKSNRLFGFLLGCKSCDEVITRHRCTQRPGLDALTVGESWECPERGSLWSVAEAEDTCGECGRSGVEKSWSSTPGPRLATAPRYVPDPFPPLRAVLAAFTAPPVRPASGCYRTASGFAVHVRPGCRCPR